MTVPLIGFVRLEDFGWERAIYHAANFGKRTRRARGKHLHGEVAQRRRFHRPGQHPSAGCIRRELVQ